jgi:FkbM family methyltransferase
MRNPLKPSTLVSTGIRQISAPDGKPFYFPDEDGIQRHIEAALFGTEYPPPFPGEFTADTIVDVGAHVGAATRHFHAAYPNARILAFEPNLSSFAMLERNTLMCGGVELVNAALAPLAGHGSLFLGRSSSMQASLVPNEENLAQHVEVACLQADTALASRDISQISILKLDTEGSELPILSALERYLPHIKVIYLEFHSEQHRLMADELLKSRFTLFHAIVTRPDRGTVGYIAKDELARMQATTKRSRHVFPKHLGPGASPPRKESIQGGAMHVVIEGKRLSPCRPFSPTDGSGANNRNPLQLQ